MLYALADELSKFLSTPSGWRATGDRRPPYCTVHISIHALRVEGDIPKIVI